MRATTVESVGSDFFTNVTDTESEVAVISEVRVNEAEVVLSDETPVVTPMIELAPAVTPVIAVPVGAADDGATERTPRPNAATATSATRLNVVFVDICFLSVVDLWNFHRSALELVS
jgi:hypothetical protein